MIRDQELAGLAMVLSRDANIKITVGGDSSFCKPDGSHINIARMLIDLYCANCSINSDFVISFSPQVQLHVPTTQ